MIVTLNTDASYNVKLGMGTYAFWIVSDMGKVSMSGVLDGEIEDPIAAEMECIVKAASVARKLFQHICTKVVVNTDCMNAIHLFSGNEPMIEKWDLKKYAHHAVRFQSELFPLKMTSSEPLSVDYRHVKAHKDIKTPREFVNDWCDKEAKRHMGMLLEKAKTNGKLLQPKVGSEVTKEA